MKPREVAGELLRIEQTGLELGERPEERVREAAEAGGAAEAVQARPSDCAPHEQRSLGIAGDGTGVAAALRKLSKDVVEGADRAREEGARPAEQVALDSLDVGRVRDDQNRIAVDRGEIVVEQTGDLAGLRRPHDEGETHPAILVRHLDGSLGAKARKFEQRAGIRRVRRGPPDRRGSGHRGLGPAPAPRDLAAAQLLGFGVGHVELAHALAGIVKGDANRRAFAVGDLGTGHVGHENGLASHRHSSFDSVKTRGTLHGMTEKITRPVARGVFAMSERG